MRPPEKFLPHRRRVPTRGRCCKPLGGIPNSHETEDMADTDHHIKVIRLLSEKLRAYYIFPDVAEKICASLQKHLDNGDYDDIAEDEFFAYALTAHVQEVCHDEHLWVKWHSESLPEEETLRLSEKWREAQQLQAKVHNFVFYRVERLAGNVGYVDIRYFHRPSWGGETAVAAMNFLAHMCAIIVDLRKCSGGYPEMISLISSYFLGTQPVHLNDIYWRDEDTTNQYWTLPHVPGRTLEHTPLFLIISKETFSAGEGFAYDMQARKRAIIIGEQTDGGAHPGASYRLDQHFEVFVPIGCPTHPITKRNWEGTGVTPDVQTAPEKALMVAYKMALASIIEPLSHSTSEPLKALFAEVQEAYKELERQ
ncbi:MAG: peptidase [Geobacteraceae bacterium]|nr:MAG: peptidase [Geobacteraceae bacterium]